MSWCLVFSPALRRERPRSDPYVIVRAAGVEQKTPVIMNNLNPVWEDQMQKSKVRSTARGSQTSAGR